jgi:hypothetical protein
MTSQITPASLGFLAIYNPSFSPGSNEDSIDDQLVYYASPSALTARRRAQRSRLKRPTARQRGRPTVDVSPAERNERLRQIGLAQGMVEFGRDFAGGSAVDFVETERSRVLVKEVEPGWWILCSVELTRVPLPPRLPTSSAPAQSEGAVEYSARELKTAPLLLQDLLRAHSLFLLQHGFSLSAILAGVGRRRFVSALTRYWDLFLSTWNVCLHGNPIRCLLGGINIAASGELGVGVGEEERGSGEREVLEGLVGRIDGLVDVVVSKFTPESSSADSTAKEEAGSGGAAGSLWLGAGKDPKAEDGAVFLGVGALSRTSLRDVTHWVEDLFTWGENAYGVIGARSYPPAGTDHKEPLPKGTGAETVPDQAPAGATAVGDPQAHQGVKEDSKPTDKRDADAVTAEHPPVDQAVEEPGETRPTEETASHQKGSETLHTDRLVNILKLGYGTYWSLGGEGNANPATPPPPERDSKPRNLQRKPADDSEGYFLIGLKGTVEEQPPSESEEDDSPAGSPSRPSTHTRILHVRLATSDGANKTPRSSSDTRDSSDSDGTALPLRAVVYVIRPFIITFLFHPDTKALADDALCRSLHYQLSPLRKPLLQSTSYRPPRPNSSTTAMYDLVFDPIANTTHSTIPDIPTGTQDPWTRADAAATHAHLLSLYAARKPRDLEATVRTNRGWWIVWSRASKARASGPATPTISEEEEEDGPPEAEALGRGGAKEVFLVRRVGEARARAFSGPAFGGDGSSATLAQGIGFDTRGYIEGLLRLGR